MRLTILVVGLLLASAVDAFTHQRPLRVRATDSVLAGLIERGLEQSRTFRRLLDDLERGEWLIFVQPGRCPDRVMVGCLIHQVGRYEGRLYLRLLVAPERRHPDVVIATLAHEFQHAREVVSDGGVTDTQSLVQFTRRIADDRFRTSQATVYETIAARRVGDTVLRELVRRGPDQTK